MYFKNLFCIIHKVNRCVWSKMLWKCTKNRKINEGVLKMCAKQDGLLFGPLCSACNNTQELLIDK